MCGAEDDSVPDGATKVVADLADPGLRGRASSPRPQGLPPVRLLVNNAARFAFDGFGAVNADEFDAHMAVNVRAPMLLTDAFAAAHDGGADALVVNLLDAKLAAPNPDFLSYTLSKQALAGLTELAARALAPQGHSRQWHRAGADAAFGRAERGEFCRDEPGQSACGAAVEPGDVVAALRYLIASPAVTGEMLTIDGGQRFWALERDVQFLERQ